MPDSDFLAMRSIAAKVWAVLLAIVAIILIATAWMAFAAFNTAHSTADCAMAGLSSNSSVPIELVALAANTMGNYKVAAVLPGFCAALLFIVAAVHILLPKPPNPGCSTRPPITRFFATRPPRRIQRRPSRAAASRSSYPTSRRCGAPVGSP